MLTCGMSFSQNYFTANNNDNAPEGDHVYADLQSCIDAAEDGDIIHIIPSETGYGDITLNKGVHLVGAGMVPDSPDGMTSKIRTITFDAATADGASLNGIVVTLYNYIPVVFGISGADVDTLRNIEINNCLIPGLAQRSNAPVKNILIRNNIFGGVNTNNQEYRAAVSLRTELGMSENVIIANNIITPKYFIGTNAQSCLSAGNQTQIKNNLFYGPSNHFGFFNLLDCLVSNNLFYGATPASFIHWNPDITGSSSGNVFTNNLTFACTTSCTFPPESNGSANVGSGNIPDSDPGIANISPGGWWNFDFDLEVSDTSPLLGAGSDGTDIGIFGGEYPFNNYDHLRGAPYVHSMAVPGIILENQDIQLDATLRSNQ